MKDWSAPFSVADANDAAAWYAAALVNGVADYPIARASSLMRDRLDYTVSSLEWVERYLSGLHVDFKKWVDTGHLPIKAFGFKSKREGQDILINTIIQCGSYLGEVIRRSDRHDLNWVRHQEWARSAPQSDLSILGASASLGTTLMMFGEHQELWLPLEKTLKRLEVGSEDCIVAFARVAGAKKAR